APDRVPFAVFAHELGLPAQPAAVAELVGVGVGLAAVLIGEGDGPAFGVVLDLGLAVDEDERRVVGGRGLVAVRRLRVDDPFVAVVPAILRRRAIGRRNLPEVAAVDAHLARRLGPTVGERRARSAARVALEGDEVPAAAREVRLVAGDGVEPAHDVVLRLLGAAVARARRRVLALLALAVAAHRERVAAGDGEGREAGDLHDAAGLEAGGAGARIRAGASAAVVGAALEAAIGVDLRIAAAAVAARRVFVATIGVGLVGALAVDGGHAAGRHALLRGRGRVRPEADDERGEARGARRVDPCSRRGAHLSSDPVRGLSKRRAVGGAPSSGGDPLAIRWQLAQTALAGARFVQPSLRRCATARADCATGAANWRNPPTARALLRLGADANARTFQEPVGPRSALRGVGGVRRPVAGDDRASRGGAAVRQRIDADVDQTLRLQGRSRPAASDAARRRRRGSDRRRRAAQDLALRLCDRDWSRLLQLLSQLAADDALQRQLVLHRRLARLRLPLVL